MGDFCHGYGFLLLISLCLLKVLFCFLFSPKYLNSVLRYDESWEIHTIQGNTCQCFKAKISNSVNDAHATPYHMSQQLVLTNISMLSSQTNGECSSPLFIYIYCSHPLCSKKQVRMKVLKDITWKIILVGKCGLPKEVGEIDVW